MKIIIKILDFIVDIFMFFLLTSVAIAESCYDRLKVIVAKKIKN